MAQITYDGGPTIAGSRSSANSAREQVQQEQTSPSGKYKYPLAFDFSYVQFCARLEHQASPMSCRSSSSLYHRLLS